MDVIAILTAAGKGKRIGGPVRKQFLILNGKPILGWTILPFQECPLVRGIICVVPDRYIRFCWEEVIRPHGFNKVLKVVRGGHTRQESVRKGLCAIDKPCDLVVIHDGVRPFVSVDMIERTIEAASRHGAVTLAISVGDTLKAVKKGMVVETVARDGIWQVQTPQAFSYELIFRAHMEAQRDGFTSTDDASLVERTGHPVRILKGSTKNIKITHPEDLDLARTILSLHHF